MKSLLVFYDADCGICTRFRRWVEGEPAHLAIRFLDYKSGEAQELCPDLLELGADRQIIVMADDGRLWQGAEAWVTCLWALRKWRGWSKRLGSPALLPIADRVCQLISSNRLSLSKLLKLKSDGDLAREVAALDPGCPDGSCETDRAGREEPSNGEDR